MARDVFLFTSLGGPPLANQRNEPSLIVQESVQEFEERIDLEREGCRDALIVCIVENQYTVDKGLNHDN